MNLSTVTGHLTQTEKKHIAHLITNKMFQGKINRKNYFLTSLGNGLYSVTIMERYIKWIGEDPKMHTAMHTFRTQG